MSTFDQILPAISEVLTAQTASLHKLGLVVINRDLNGRVRLVVNVKVRDDAEAWAALDAIVHALIAPLGPHGFPAERMVLFEADVRSVTQGVPHFTLEGFDAVIVVDRLATETDWASIAPVAAGAPRMCTPSTTVSASSPTPTPTSAAPPTAAS